jgi:CDGSH-type Zn-finger protein
MANKKVNKKKIKISRNGPYLVYGRLPLKKEIIIRDNNGHSVAWQKAGKFEDKDTYLLCRCGQSSMKPYCDNAHLDIGFDGSETASIKNFSSMVEKYSGPELDLDDAVALCARASFCVPEGGTWKLTQESDDKEKKALAIKQCADCPSGRLVAREKNGKIIEPELDQELSIVEDPGKQVSGPIWVKGYVPIESAEGKEYETRNRATLCRCGQSKNKPFCDGTHIEAKFTDGDESLDVK